MIGLTETTTTISVNDIRMSYRLSTHWTGRGKQDGNTVTAVDGVSFTVERGEIVALIGESGCGKTTVANCILGLARPSSGSIVYRGVDVTRLRGRRLRSVRRSIQLLFQDPYDSLDSRLAVGQLVEEPLLLHASAMSKSDRRHAVLRAIETVGLVPAEGFVRRLPHELSGGQRQRVAIASSLVLRPSLLIADEPVSMLDVSVRAGILSLFGRLRDEFGLSILMISHDIATTIRIADRILVMYMGKLVESGTIEQVVDRPAHPYTRALLAVVPRRDGGPRSVDAVLGGEVGKVRRPTVGCRFAPRCPLVGPKCILASPELEPVPAALVVGHEAACWKAVEQQTEYS